MKRPVVVGGVLALLLSAGAVWISGHTHPDYPWVVRILLAVLFLLALIAVVFAAYYPTPLKKEDKSVLLLNVSNENNRWNKLALKESARARHPPG